MRQYVFPLIGISILASSAHAETEQRPIQRLSWLIGSWTFSDEAVDGSYKETGTRDCEYTLNDTYILCRSVGTSNSGKVRSYHFYFNYNDRNNRFEMTSLTAFYPHKDLYVMSLSADNRVIESRSRSWTEDGLRPQNEATIVYNGDNQYIWNIRTGYADGETGSRAVTFRDTVNRVD